jgi:hypothetical protein
MTAMELYKLLDKHLIEFDVVEIFEGLRTINVCVDEPTDDDLEDEVNQND